MSNQETGITEKLTTDMNTNYSVTEPIPQNSSELNAEKSESTWQFLKRTLFGNGGSKGLSKAVKKKKLSSSLQNVIAYDLMFEDGICDLGDGRYSITVGFDDINYQSAGKNNQYDTFKKYCEVLEYFSPDVHFQVSIINRLINEETLKNTTFIKNTGDKFDRLRTERNAIISQQSIAGDSDVVSDKYLTITIKADNYDHARRDLLRLLNDTQENLKNMDSHSEQASGLTRLTTIYNFFNPFDTFMFKYVNLVHSNLTTKDYVIPEDLEFKSKYFTFNGKYGCAMYIRDYPTSLNDRFIKDISDINCQMSINLHLYSLDKAEALVICDSQTSKMEQRKQDLYTKAARRKEMPIIPRELQLRIDEADDLRKAIDNAGMKMFKATVIITVAAESKEKLKDCIERVKGVGRQHGCDIIIATALQKEGLNSSLLLGNNQLNDYVTRTLTSASAGIFIPFTTQELLQPGGIYYGLNRESHNIISFDRKSLLNPNGVVLATSGAGKSFRCKREATDIFLSTNDQIIFLDPEREYSPLTKMLGGQTVFLSLSSENHINPFEINENYAGDEKENPIAFKADFITSLIQQIAGGKQGLSQMTLSIIDRCVNKIYEPYFTTNPKKAEMPTFVDFWNALKEQKEQEAQDLAVALERYVKGNLNVFSHKGNVDLNNRLVCLDIRDLGTQLKPLGMLIALDFIWNRITKNREEGITTWLYADEFYLFFSEEHTAKFFANLWCRARKWGAIPTAITQNVEQVLASEHARTVLSTSDFAVLLSNTATNQRELAHLYNLSDKQLKYITNTSAGQGLIVAGKNIIPFEDKVPKDTELYKVLTTKPDEVQVSG